METTIEFLTTVEQKLITRKRVLGARNPKKSIARANRLVEVIERITGINIVDNRTRKREVVNARAIACEILYDEFMNYQDVALFLKFRDHTCVMYHRQKMLFLIENPHFNRSFYKLMLEIKIEYSNELLQIDLD